MERDRASSRIGWVTILGYLAVCGMLIGVL